YYLYGRSTPNTLGSVKNSQAVVEAILQSVNTRTTGFVTITQANLNITSLMLTVFLMFIGDSTTGTTDENKTDTLTVKLAEVRATIKGEPEAICFKRQVPRQTTRKAIAITLISVAASVLAVLIMYFIQPGDMTDNVFEVYSALGTVGISRDLT